jgi:hypothetical protein
MRPILGVMPESRPNMMEVYVEDAIVIGRLQRNAIEIDWLDEGYSAIDAR